MDRIANVAMAIVGVAMITTIVAHPGSAKVVTAVGRAFANSIRAATGK